MDEEGWAISFWAFLPGRLISLRAERPGEIVESDDGADAAILKEQVCLTWELCNPI